MRTSRNGSDPWSSVSMVNLMLECWLLRCWKKLSSCCLLCVVNASRCHQRIWAWALPWICWLRWVIVVIPLLLLEVVCSTHMPNSGKILHQPSRDDSTRNCSPYTRKTSSPSLYTSNYVHHQPPAQSWSDNPRSTIPLRPIVSTRGSPTYNTAQHLATILQPLSPIVANIFRVWNISTTTGNTSTQTLAQIRWRHLHHLATQ